MNETLARFYFEDLKKTKVGKFERAKVIREYLDLKKLSIREFAVKFHIHRSTVEDWLLYNRIDEEHYKELIKQGYNSKQLYKILRENKRVELKIDSKLDHFLESNTVLLNQLLNNHPVFTPKTKELIHGLKDSLNRCDMKRERKQAKQ